MNTSLLIGLVAFFSLILGFIIGNLLSKLKTKQQITEFRKRGYLQNKSICLI